MNSHLRTTQTELQRVVDAIQAATPCCGRLITAQQQQLAEAMAIRASLERALVHLALAIQALQRL